MLMLETQHDFLFITLNRPEKHHAFDDHMIAALQHVLDHEAQHPHLKAIVLRSHGPHFSAGADLDWMQRMANASEADNIQDALQLSHLLHTLYTFHKPTVSLVQGSAFGGGVGLIAATDIVCASERARFAFSEVKLGLMPATISPYIIQAIGARASKALFLSGESFDAHHARTLGLVHHVFATATFDTETSDFLSRMATLPKDALALCKKLVFDVMNEPIDIRLSEKTAHWIAARRRSQEGLLGIAHFLNSSKRPHS